MARQLSDEETIQSDTTDSSKSVSESHSHSFSESITPDLALDATSLMPVQRTSAETDIDSRSDGPATRGEYEQRYGVEIGSPGQAARLQRLEASNSLSAVQRWAEEGIPIDAMGTPSQMEAYRTREGTPVPWNVEQRNAQSLQRSTRAAEDTSPAGETQVPESVRNVVSSSGEPVETALRKPVESEIGQSLEHARVHRSPAADAACEQLNARAFTVNNHVAVRSDQPDPSTPAGQHLMSHELTHVAQQTGGAVSLLPDAGALEVDPDPQLEQEAEETAQRVMQGGELGIQRLSDTDVHVQRSCLPRSNTVKPDKTVDSKVDPSLQSLGLSKQEFDKRHSRLTGRGYTDDPGSQRRIPGPIRQAGTSCWLAALQAAWATLGADTSSLRKILEHYPSQQSPREVHALQTSSFASLGSMFKRVRNIDADIKKQVSKEVGGIETFSARMSHDVKGTALALANLYQLKRTTTGPDGKSPLVTDEDLQIGRNVLQMVSHKSQLSFMADDWHMLLPSSDMNALKTKFMKLVNRLGTPLIVAFRSRFNRNIPNVPIEKLPGFGPVSHAAIVSGVSVEGDGSVSVQYRDGHHYNDTYDRQQLSEFLMPRHSPAISKGFKSRPGISDMMIVGKMRTDDETRSKLTNK